TVIGDLQGALDEAGRLLGAVGRVVPAAAEPVVLKAESGEGDVEGQSAVANTAGIRRVSLVPTDASPSPVAVDALSEADQVVIGPGSLFTSVLAAAAVPGMAAAISASPGRRVYVANLRPQPAETEGYDVAAHLHALEAHGVGVDVVVADSSGIALGDVAIEVVDVPLAGPRGLAHDPARLAKVLAGLVG
ncbi:MAG TPA: 2-phospho-L-lactate transferase CofD family protein, partial [Acidimicrobiales bacterium]|nr:2-phospho-L-lactate transferase CofD family protein [Acidimicrobiales bacterium]